MTEERFDYLTEELDLEWEAPEFCEELRRARGQDYDLEHVSWDQLWDYLILELMRYSASQDSRRTHWLRQTQ